MGDLEIPNEAEVEEMVQSLADWVSKQPHLPRIQDDKKLLRKFLINCKYRVQKAKTKIDQYYSARTAHPTVYLDRDPTAEHIRTISKLCPLFPLPKRTSNGELVLIARADPDAGQIVPMDYMRYLTMVLDIIFLEEEANLDYIVIIDCRGVSFQHLLKITTIGSVMVELVLDTYPGRFKGDHLVFVPSFVDSIVALFKRMVKPKFRERLHVHAGLESLHKALDPGLLPSDLGGNEKSIHELNDKYREKVTSYKDWLKTQDDVRTKEELRSAASKESMLMGVKGSFRKLNFD